IRRWKRPNQVSATAYKKKARRVQEPDAQCESTCAYEKTDGACQKTGAGDMDELQATKRQPRRRRLQARALVTGLSRCDGNRVRCRPCWANQCIPTPHAFNDLSL